MKPYSQFHPRPLSAYARVSGWVKAESYGDFSDVYATEGMPEIILPRTNRLGDYPNIVSRLIEIFARVTDTDELSLYRDLVTADRDVVRVRALGEHDGTVDVDDGISLIRGARDMFLAAACSLVEPRRLYRAGANKEANEYLRKVRLGQTEHGSFVATLLTPVVSPPIQQPLTPDWGYDDDPIERRVTKRLSEALVATREATEKTIVGDDDAFSKTVTSGASANLFEALVQSVEPFFELEVSIVWARTRPMGNARKAIRFAKEDVPILNEAARLFRNREPKLDEQLFGFVQRLKRDEHEVDGTVSLRASIEGRTEAVMAVLNQNDYEQAITAHKERSPVIAVGDLERVGQRWHLSSPRIIAIIRRENASDEDD